MGKIAKMRREARLRRHRRVRKKIRGTPMRPRLAVFRSSKHIYAQLIDDVAGETLVAASTLTPELRDALESTSTVAGAGAVGRYLAEKAVEKDIHIAVLDRGGYRYHGRVAALADAAREAGLDLGRSRARGRDSVALHDDQQARKSA